MDMIAYLGLLVVRVAVHLRHVSQLTDWSYTPFDSPAVQTVAAYCFSE